MSDSGTAFMALEPARNSSSAVLSSTATSAAGVALANSACPSTEPTTVPSAFGSMIMMTLPSPRMVLPENMPTSRNRLDIGFTTISSVRNTLSTSAPKRRAPTWMTTTVRTPLATRSSVVRLPSS